MQNEFEKQVQQKMEELKLVPSDPVWQKVEMQIRKKKDRRRVIFWIPLLFLLGGGLWLVIDQYSNQTSYSKGNEKTQKQIPVVIPESPNQLTEESSPTSVHYNKSTTQNISSVPGTKGKKINFNTAPDKSASKKIKRQTGIPLIETKNVPSKAEEIIEKDVTNINPSQIQSKVNVADTGLKTLQPTDTASTSKDKIKTVPESIKQDSVLMKTPEVKKHALSKWKYNLVVTAGISGLGRINVYNGQKSLSVYNSPPAGASGGGSQFSNYGPSQIEKGFSFAVGTVTKKQLSGRTSFAAGLQYNYYSNTIQVGNRINQARVIMDYAVSQFYSNQTTQTTPLQPYRNQYHFISLPAIIDWQLLKKYPLNLSTSLSMQYLIHTNALRFDYTTQSYFNDINAFNRAQLLSEFSLTYSVPLKQKPFTFGPQFQYGLTRLEKGNSDHHLFSYGLKAQWQLKKK